MNVKVGDTVYVLLDDSMELTEATVIKETEKYYVFSTGINDSSLSRRKQKKNVFKTKEDAIESQLIRLNKNLEFIETDYFRVFEFLKKVEKDYPEILL